MPDVSGRPSRYQLVGELARGGMGAIFQGRDLELGRDLAVKVIREEHRDRPEMVRRFVEEAQIGGQLQHPGIVPVHELGRLPDGRVFIAMKLVRGRTLAALLAERRGPDDDRIRFLSIFERVCQAMAYAHARGVVHRDMKPSNIMVGAFGEVQVMDWGLAMVLDQGGIADEERAVRPSDDPAIWTLRSRSEAMESRPDSVLGTPSYMAPEQARGALDTLDERADVFALGSILCEILTGEPAFAGEGGAEVYRKAERADLSEAIARLDACDADAELVGLARTCLAAAPKHRPRDAGIVVDGLTAYLRGVEGACAKPSWPRRGRKPAPPRSAVRRRLTLALAVSVLTTALIGAAGWGWVDHERRRREEQTRGAVDAALADASTKRERALAAGGDPVLWVEAIEAARRAESLLGSGDTGAVPSAARALLPGRSDPRARRGGGRREGPPDRRAARHDPQRLRGPRRRSEGRRGVRLRVPRLRGRPRCIGPGGFRQRARLQPRRRGPGQLARSMGVPASGAVLRDPVGAERLVAMARVADPDPWRNRLRDSLGRREGGPARRLERWSGSPPPPTSTISRWRASPAWPRRSRSSGGGGRPSRSSGAPESSHRDDFWVNADLVRELMATGLAEEAVRFFTVAAGVRPRSGLALSGLGKALLMSGQPEEAADTFREVTRLRPDDALAHVALGTALLALGEPQEADVEFGEARRLRSDDWMVRDQIALAYSDRGDWAAAVEEQRESARRFPKLAVVHKALAHALQSSGRLDEAVAEFREAVRLDPRFSAAYLFLGRALIEAGDLQAALDALARVDVGPPPPDPVLTASSLAARAERMIALGRDSPPSPRGATARRTPRNSRRSPGSPSRVAGMPRRPACGPRRSPHRRRSRPTSPR